jgi:hypothetical protein
VHAISVPYDATSAALQVIIAKLQIITVREFLPIIASFDEGELRAWKPFSDKPDTSVEVRALACNCGLCWRTHSRQHAKTLALMHVPSAGACAQNKLDLECTCPSM